MLDRMIHHLCSTIAFFLGIFLYLSPQAQTAIGASNISEILTRAGVGFVTIVGVLISFSLIPFQRIDQLSIFSISDYFLKNKKTQFILTYMFLFPLFTYISAIDNIFLEKKVLFPLWIFGFGIGLDCLREYYYKVCYLIDPFKRVSYLEERGMFVINKQQYESLNKKIVQASEATYQAIQNKNIVLSEHIIAIIKRLACYFLKSVKNVNLNKARGHYKRKEKIYDDNSILSSFCSHLEFIFNAAIKYKFEDSCNQVLTSLSVITIYTLELKPSLPSSKWTSFTLLPLNSIQYCLSKAKKLSLGSIIESSSGALKALLLELYENTEKYPHIEEEGKYIIDLLTQCSDHPNNLGRILPFFQDFQQLLQSSEKSIRSDLQSISQYLEEIIPLLSSSKRT